MTVASSLTPCQQLYIDVWLEIIIRIYNMLLYIQYFCYDSSIGIFTQHENVPAMMYILFLFQGADSFPATISRKKDE